MPKQTQVRKRTVFIEPAAEITSGIVLKGSGLTSGVRLKHTPGILNFVERSQAEPPIISERISIIYRERILKHWNAHKHSKYNGFTRINNRLFQVHRRRSPTSFGLYEYYIMKPKKKVRKTYHTDPRFKNFVKPYRRCDFVFDTKSLPVLHGFIPGEETTTEPVIVFTSITRDEFDYYVQEWLDIFLGIVSDDDNYEDSYMEAMNVFDVAANNEWEITSIETLDQLYVGFAHFFNLDIEESKLEILSYFKGSFEEIEAEEPTEIPITVTCGVPIVPENLKLGVLSPLWIFGNDVIKNHPYFIGGSIGNIRFDEMLALRAKSRIENSPVRGFPHLLNAIGELPETAKSIADLLDFGRRLMIAIKQKDFPTVYNLLLSRPRSKKNQNLFLSLAKQGINLDFAWKFGIKPLLDDINSLIELSDSYTSEVNHRGEIIRRSRVDWDEKIPFEHTIENLSYTIDDTSMEYDVSFTGSVNFSVTYGANVVISNPIKFFFEQLGFTSLLGTAWQLVPLSFVIDWFIDIGAAINRVTDFDLKSFALEQEYVTYNTVFEGKATFGIRNLVIRHNDKSLAVNLSQDSFTLPCSFYNMDRGYFHDTYSLEEKVALDLSKPEKSLITLNQFMTLSELIAQRLL